MKRIFYPFVTMLLVATLLSAINANAQSYTISFPNSPPPTSDPSLDQNDHLTGVPEDAIEVGTRFRVTQPGTITRIRFLKGNLVTGTHIGHLWSNTGTQLAQATFSETANGWQEVTVSVHINPGVTYVASVFSNVGDYAAENNIWTGGTDWGTAPIKVIAYLNDPARNGVYKYLFNATNPTGAFPDQDGSAANYWVDVRFVPDFPLPVTLVDFKATVNTNNVALTWKTETEYNNRGFEIQRSNNGSDWYALNFINGTGESYTVKNYSHTDKALAPGLYYYRLKQTDYDGKTTFSSVVTATISGKGNASLVAPNPFFAGSVIRYDLPAAQKIKLSLIDMTGREMKVLVNNQSEAGTHQVQLDAVNLPKQIYLLRLQTEAGIITRRILVQ